MWLEQNIWLSIFQWNLIKHRAGKLFLFMNKLGLLFCAAIKFYYEFWTRRNLRAVDVANCHRLVSSIYNAANCFARKQFGYFSLLSLVWWKNVNRRTNNDEGFVTKLRCFTLETSNVYCKRKCAVCFILQISAYRFLFIHWACAAKQDLRKVLSRSLPEKIQRPNVGFEKLW